MGNLKSPLSTKNIIARLVRDLSCFFYGNLYFFCSRVILTGKMGVKSVGGILAIGQYQGVWEFPYSDFTVL